MIKWRCDFECSTYRARVRPGVLRAHRVRVLGETSKTPGAALFLHRPFWVACAQRASLQRELQTPPLPPAVFGDYNGDAIVDGRDYVLSRKTAGTTVAPYSGADGIDVWRAHFGATYATGRGASSEMAMAGSGALLGEGPRSRSCHALRWGSGRATDRFGSN